MKFKLEVSLGVNKITIEEECEGVKGLFEQASIYSTFPKECNNCKGGNLALNARKTSKGKYYEITCQDCGYRKEYGQYQEDDGLFPKDWKAPYTPQADTNTEASAPTAPAKRTIPKVEQEETSNEVEDAPKAVNTATTQKEALTDIMARYKAKVQKNMKVQA